MPLIPQILSPRAPFPGFQPRFVRSSPGPCRLKRAALLRWSRVSASSTYNPQTDKYLHCLSIMKAGKARLPYCKFIFPRKSRDKQCRTHSHKPGPLIKRGSPQREKQRSLSFCHSNSLPLICCSVSRLRSLNQCLGWASCVSTAPDATGHFACRLDTLFGSAKREKDTAQLLDKAPGIVPDRAAICIDKTET